MVLEVCAVCGRLEGRDCTLYRFPTDVASCNEWARLVERYDLLDMPPGECAEENALCSAHFRPEDFNGFSLKPDAVPLSRQVFAGPQYPPSEHIPWSTTHVGRFGPWSQQIIWGPGDQQMLLTSYMPPDSIGWGPVSSRSRQPARTPLCAYDWTETEKAHVEAVAARVEAVTAEATRALAAEIRALNMGAPDHEVYDVGRDGDRPDRAGDADAVETTAAVGTDLEGDGDRPDRAGDADAVETTAAVGTDPEGDGDRPDRAGDADAVETTAAVGTDLGRDGDRSASAGDADAVETTAAVGTDLGRDGDRSASVDDADVVETTAAVGTDLGRDGDHSASVDDADVFEITIAATMDLVDTPLSDKIMSATASVMRRRAHERFSSPQRAEDAEPTRQGSTE